MKHNDFSEGAVPSLAETHPELAAEWHPTKNGELTPADVTAGSNKKIWWFLPYTDPATGKHFDFEWKSIINHRTRQNHGCPYLSGKAVFVGFNDLATVRPDIAAQWHPTKNADLQPTDVSTGSTRRVWWLMPYTDPGTGKQFNFEWESSVQNRVRSECPQLAGRAVHVGFNDLGTTHPIIAQEWHPTKNGKLKPTDVTAGSKKVVWWYLPYDDAHTGKHFDFEWEARISSRAHQNAGCPFLSGKANFPGFTKFAWSKERT